MRLSDDAQAVGEWSARCVSLAEDLLAMTRTAAGLSLSNCVLRARLDSHSAVEEVLEPGGRDGFAPRDELIELLTKERDEWKREADRLMAEHADAVGQLLDWKRQFELSDESCTKLSGWLKDREERLNELSAEWEAQAAKIMELERQLAERPDACPACATSLVPAAPADQEEQAEPAGTSPPQPLAFGTKKACRGCRKKFIAHPANRQYCDACKAPKKGETK